MAATTPRALGEARHHKVLSNSIFNWASTIVAAVCAFVLAPVMVHHLGDSGYGIWTFGIQLTTYLSILDFGVRASVSRFLTFHHTRGERSEINGVISVAIALLSGMATVCILVSCFIAVFLNHIVKISPGMLRQAQWTIMLISGMVAFSLPGAIFAGAIASLSRYDILNLRYMGTYIVRTFVTWLVLIKGGGILAVAAAWLMVAIVSFGVDVLIANRLYGRFELNFDFKKYRGVAKSLFAFSFYAFVAGISTRLVLWSDNVVIAMILGPVAVTFYAIGGNLVDLSRATLNGITTVFVPLATSYQAKGESSSLRHLLVRGSRMGLVITLPVITAFFIIGKDFIGLWMGPRYVSVAGAVLIFLSVPLLFAALQATSNQILYGMSRHQLYAWIVLTEALINLGLSIFLAYKVGVIGVAIGTMIPAIIFEGIFVPIYTAGLLKQSVWGFYWHSWVKPCVLSLPYAAWLFALHRLGWSNSWTGFVTTVASGLLIYAGMVWFGILSSDEKQSLMRRIRPVPAPVRATS